MALNALDGSLEIIALKVRFVLMWRDLMRSLDYFLLSLHNLLITAEQELVDLAILRFFLIWDKRGHLGGFGGGGRVNVYRSIQIFCFKISFQNFQ